MSATLTISVAPTESSDLPAWGAIVRVQPLRGRPIETSLRPQRPENIEVPPGELYVEVNFPSGQRESHSLVLADGERRSLDLAMPSSPHDAMRWLSLSREPTQSAERAPAYRSHREHVTGGLESGSAGGSSWWPEIILRGEAGQVSIASDQRYDECRVLHVSDERGVHIFSSEAGSALALLKLQSPELLSASRIAALPSPLFGVALREVHVALREVADDVLPDVQIVPADGRLAQVVGFLERGDQRALGLVGTEFADEAVDLMRGKMRSPLAATIGLAVLLRLRQLDQVKGWSRNLWQWFPALPDGGALHAAVMLRAPSEDEGWLKEFREAALGAARAGMPLLSDSLRHLREALALLQNLDDDHDDAEVNAAARWCNGLLRALDPDAVFTTVTIDTKNLEQVWGVSPTKEGTT
jgi:hypothetical protein